MGSVGAVAAGRPVTLRDGDDEMLAEHARQWAEIRSERWARVVPARYVDARLSDLPDGIRDDVEAWTSTQSNLVLCGPVGTGKSHAAAAAVRRRFDRGEQIVWWSVMWLMDALRPGAPDPNGVLRAAMLADVLVLDDLVAEKPSEWTRERLDLIVDARWSDRVPIIVTTNASPRALRETLDARVVSRLADDATVLVLSGEDRRG